MCRAVTVLVGQSLPTRFYKPTIKLMYLVGTIFGGLYEYQCECV